MRCIYLTIMLVAALVFSCEVERDNPLDPKNPDSETETVVMAEVFVNTNVQIGNRAIDALENLETEFSERLIVLEYHFDNAAFPDIYGTEDAFLRYQTLRPGEDHVVPRCFVNVDKGDFIGASSVEAPQARYLEAVNDAISGSSRILIEGEKQLSGSSLNVSVRIARLGDSPLNNAQVFLVTYEDLQSQGENLRHVVRDYIPNVAAITNLDAGDVLEFDTVVPDVGYSDISTARVVIAVMNEQTLAIQHALLVKE